MPETLQDTLRQGGLGQPGPGQQVTDPDQALRQKLQQQQLNTQSPQLVRDASGQLTQQSTQGIQQLSTAAGLPAPPTTALGAAAIGANPDQQKMMGTPAQKTAALSLATAPQNDLTTAVRTAQARSQQTGTEQAETKKSQDMNNLGSLGDRVSDFINAQRQKIATADTAVTANPSAVQVQTAATVQNATGQDAFASMTPDQVVNAKNLLAQLHSDPTNQNLQLQVQTMLGQTATTGGLDPAKINDLYESAVNTISRSGADTVDNSLTTQDLLNNSKFGYSADQLSNLLGVPQDQLLKMNVGTLRQTIDSVTQQEFSKSQTLQQQAGSVNLGAAERGAARQAGQEASATGVRASEDDMNRMVQSIHNADVVQFGGQSYQVDALLKDSTISGIIADYVNSAPGSSTRTQLDQSEPQLSKFIADNQAVLTDAATKLSSGAQTFQTTQTYNKGLPEQIFGPGGLAAATLAKLAPQLGQLQAQKLDVKDVPILQLGQQAGPDGAKLIAQKINNQVDKDSTIADKLAGYDIAHLNNLQIDKPGGMWDKFIQYRDFGNNIKNTTDSNQVINAAFSDVHSIADLTSRVTAAKALGTLGMNPGMSVIPTDINSIKNTITSQMGNFSLDDAAEGNARDIPQPKQLGQPNYPASNTLQGSIFHKLAAAAADGNIDKADINGADLSQDEAAYLRDISKSGKGNIDTAAANDKWVSVTTDVINKAVGDKNDPTNMQNIISLSQQDPTHYPPNLVQSQVLSPYAKAMDQVYANSPYNSVNVSSSTKKLLAGSMPGISNASQYLLKGINGMLDISSSKTPAQTLAGISVGGDDVQVLMQVAQKLGVPITTKYDLDRMYDSMDRTGSASTGAGNNTSRYSGTDRTSAGAGEGPGNSGGNTA